MHTAFIIMLVPGGKKSEKDKKSVSIQRKKQKISKKLLDRVYLRK